jgi:hypothetical protein
MSQSDKITGQGIPSFTIDAQPGATPFTGEGASLPLSNRNPFESMASALDMEAKSQDYLARVRAKKKERDLDLYGLRFERRLLDAQDKHLQAAMLNPDLSKEEAVRAFTKEHLDRENSVDGITTQHKLIQEKVLLRHSPKFEGAARGIAINADTNQRIADFNEDFNGILLDSEEMLRDGTDPIELSKRGIEEIEGSIMLHFNSLGIEEDGIVPGTKTSVTKGKTLREFIDANTDAYLESLIINENLNPAQRIEILRNASNPSTIIRDMVKAHPKLFSLQEHNRPSAEAMKAWVSTGNINNLQGVRDLLQRVKDGDMDLKTMQATGVLPGFSKDQASEMQGYITTGQMDQAFAAADYVDNNVRTFSIPIANGGSRPLTAQGILRRIDTLKNLPAGNIVNKTEQAHWEMVLEDYKRSPRQFLIEHNAKVRGLAHEMDRITRGMVGRSDVDAGKQTELNAAIAAFHQTLFLEQKSFNKNARERIPMEILDEAEVQYFKEMISHFKSPVPEDQYKSTTVKSSDSLRGFVYAQSQFGDYPELKLAMFQQLAESQDVVDVDHFMLLSEPDTDVTPRGKEHLARFLMDKEHGKAPKVRPSDIEIGKLALSEDATARYGTDEAMKGLIVEIALSLELQDMDFRKELLTLESDDDMGVKEKRIALIEKRVRNSSVIDQFLKGQGQK